ncbi:type VII secretion-associated serine protease mycosin [Amycolatopsis sp. A133]|uniref:type VII secretion-associated serine protease mycosin n=1 Tax=Amycolatopsis sp. A133 TaxID=3064472 RepID=UPI0027F39A0E|nr:type VII secretion-associated serine protease mycosin [Amycolatopsis sp. A133]MDQ7810883.1 type VII secretion-associated serine protease mycosin [Amycolatopsis sp. A133]
MTGKAGRRPARCLLAAGLLWTVLPAAPAAAQQAPAPLPAEQLGCLPPPVSAEPGVPWAQQRLVPERVWPLTKGAGVTVGVVDTGVDAQTPQLAGGRVQRGQDVANPGGGPADADCFGHGTFVAGIIAAGARPDTGFAGIAPEATILPIRCATLTPDGSPPVLTAVQMADGIRAAVDGGARVVNISASTNVPDPELEKSVQHAADRDVVVVASAANSAQQGDPVTYPAAFPGVLAVGAVDATGKKADFSQTGGFLSLVAPGVGVTSVGPGGAGHWLGSGTSYAAPFVAGVAALVRAYHPQLSAAQVKRRLELTADHPAAALPDPGFGWGTVNAVAAVTTVLPEETGGLGPVVTPAPAPVPPVPPVAGAGATVALAAAVAVPVVALVALLFSRLLRGARTRRWLPARVAEVAGAPGQEPSTNNRSRPGSLGAANGNLRAWRKHSAEGLGE